MQKPIEIQLEEYIPLKIRFTKEIRPLTYISYSKGTGSLLEFGVNEYTGIIQQITLVICDDFAESKKKISVDDYIDSDTVIKGKPVECNTFKILLYSNGVRIMLSDKKSLRYNKIDRVYIGLSDDNDIAEVCVYDMNDSELGHLRHELENCDG